MKNNRIKLDVDKVLRDLVDKHNQLSINFSNISAQFAGSLNSIGGQIDLFNQQLNSLQNQHTIIAFHINKIQGEFTALRNCLTVKGIDLGDFKKYADDIFKAEFGIDSDYLPVGVCKITHYGTIKV